MQIWRHFFSQIIVFSKEKIDSEAKIAYYLRKKTVNACIYQKLLLILQSIRVKTPLNRHDETYKTT